MRRLKTSVMIIAILMISIVVQGQRTGKLIINPEISEFASVPLTGGSIVRSEDPKTPPQNPKRKGSFPKIENAEWPTGALITGIVPDPSKAWAVAVTQNEEEFLRALPEYRRLIAEGKWREANEVLYVTTSINVSTKVEQFRDEEKIRELPEKLGTFFFTFGTHEFKKHGGYLTFLTYTRDPDKSVVKIGNDIGETIHGALQIEKTEGKGDFKFGYAMKIIKAEIRE